ncbi:MAG: precorrin-6A reductase [Lachnospiraceae bacterium]|nr:precorrin-6A reductase [Lachnospiraceae bacterium]
MSSILIFAGTTEGRKLSEILSVSQIEHDICVATDYGREVLNESPYMNVHTGRMDYESMLKFIKDGNFNLVVDATHPYAIEVTKNIVKAANESGLEYIRLRRDSKANEGENIRYYDSVSECADALKNTDGNILLTTGSKELPEFCVSGVTERIYARVIPSMESLRICEENGIKGKQIIAMQGPFTMMLNVSLMQQYNIRNLVTKASGTFGGYEDKIDAAKMLGGSVFVISPKQNEDGENFNDVLKHIEKVTGKEIKNVLDITLAGIGMGSKSLMTIETLMAIQDADVVMGAQRVIDTVDRDVKKYPYYLAKDIIPCFDEMPSGKALILYSGDSGFYSGTAKLYKELLEYKDSHKDREVVIRIFPGISSVSYLAAKLGVAYESANILSIHGRKVNNIVSRIKHNKDSFILVSGKDDITDICERLVKAGLGECVITAGLNLSYPDEKIVEFKAADKIELSDGIYTLYIFNPNAVSKEAGISLTDEDMIRDAVPMTKEEVRDISISKLHLKNDSVLYDIGSGTGSIAVASALLSDDINVYAIEMKDEAVELINKNKDKFMLDNINVIKAKAPDGLKDLPKATHAFIGGSSGNMKEIIMALRDINLGMRVVINAVSLETIGEISSILNDFNIENEEIIQVQVDRGYKAGSHRLMKAENPVYICAFDLGDKQ